jgi:Na+/citrate or Na+/malate symporter
VNFTVRLTGAPNGNIVQVDELQVRVYHITPVTGGGGGGGAIPLF